jgi:hypothetical protein
MCSDRSDWLKPAGFPHLEIQGSRVVCTSPWLIAAYHVLHRLHAPRHPPCALSSLTIKFAHRKLDQHIVSLTPSSSRMPDRLWTIQTSRRNLSILGICLFDCQRTLRRQRVVKSVTSEPVGRPSGFAKLPTSALNAILVTARLQVLVEVRGLEPLTPWLQTMCSAS